MCIFCVFCSFDTNDDVSSEPTVDDHVATERLEHGKAKCENSLEVYAVLGSAARTTEPSAANYNATKVSLCPATLIQ